MNGTEKLNQVANLQQEQPPEQADAYNAGSRVFPANFSPEQKDEMRRIIEDEMELIKSEYEAEGYYDLLRSCEENYQAAHVADVSPLTGGYDIRIPFHKIIVEILVSRALRQTIQADPIVLMEQEGEISDDDLRSRENRLDFCLRNQIKIDELLASVYEHAIYEPVCITKTIECHEEEEVTRVETYGPQDIDRFDNDFSSMLLDPTSEESKQRQLLLSGQTVTIPVTETKVIYSGPKVYRVDNAKFYARPKIKDFRKQRVHGEQMDYTWADIEMRANSKAYRWDKDAVEVVKKAYGEDYRKAIVPFYEMIVQYDKEGDGHMRRYVVTMEAKTREIVKAVLYTNTEMSYTAHSVKAKDDSWIGESMLPLINDLVDVVCANFNYMLYANDLGHTPVILSNDPNAITRREIKLGVVNVIPFEKDTSFQTVTLANPGFDRLAFIQTLLDLVYLLSGVDPALLSGAETPQDPNAPAAKTAMKMQVTNMRVEDKIIRLQYGDVALCEKVEKILYSMGNPLDYWNKGKLVKVSKDAYNVPVRYMMHGSKMTFSRQADLGLTMQFVEILNKFYPGIWADYEVKRAILGVIIQDMGGSIDKMKDTMTARIDAYLEMQKRMEAIKQAMGSQGGSHPMAGQDQPMPEISNGVGAPNGMAQGGAMPAGGASGMQAASAGSVK